jgi:aspartyl protease family protein
MSGLSDLAIAQPLLIITILAVLAASAGWMVERERPALALALRRTGYLGMLAAGLLLVGQLAHDASRSDAALLLRERPALSVSGEQTVIPMAGDGHFWVRAEVNGTELDLLVDTGATYTSLSQSSADAIGLKPDPLRAPARLDTANGTVTARMGVLESLRFGTIEAQQVEAVILPSSSGDTAVLGMNVLSRLGGWRVEGDKLVLVP